jgi:hypothetical protein
VYGQQDVDPFVTVQKHKKALPLFVTVIIQQYDEKVNNKTYLRYYKKQREKTLHNT